MVNQSQNSVPQENNGSPEISTVYNQSPIPVKRSPLPVVLFLLLIAALASSFYLLYQNIVLRKQLMDTAGKNSVTNVSPTITTSVSNQTASWRQIKKLLVEFKIPETWHYLECNDSLIFVGSSIDKDQTTECAFDGSPGIISISRRVSPQPLDIPDVNSSEPHVTQRTTTTVDGKTAVMQLEEITFGQGKGKRWQVYIRNSEYMDVITLNDISQKEVFDQFLQTVVFTGKTVTPMPTTTTAPVVYKGTNCPVTFTIPPEISQNWVLRDDIQRFFYIPRAEEFNGKRTSLGTNSGQGEVGLAIGCQDNLNKWSMNDFKQYILRADEMKDRVITDVHMWNHDVFQLTYSTTSNTDPQTFTVWLFSTPTKLISVSKINGYLNSPYTKDIDTIFSKGISFSI